MKNIILGTLLGSLIGFFGAKFYPLFQMLILGQSRQEVIQRIEDRKQFKDGQVFDVGNYALTDAMNLSKKNEPSLERIIDDKRFRTYFEAKHDKMIKEFEAENQQRRNQVYDNVTNLELLEYEAYLKSEVLAKTKKNSLQLAGNHRAFYEESRKKLVATIETEAREMNKGTEQK